MRGSGLITIASVVVPGTLCLEHYNSNPGSFGRPFGGVVNT